MDIGLAELLVDEELNVMESNQFFRDTIRRACQSLADVISQRDILTVFETMEALGESEEKVVAVRILTEKGVLEWQAMAISMGIGENRKKIFRISLWSLEELRADLRTLQQRLQLIETNRGDDAYNYHYDAMMHILNKEAIIKFAKERFEAKSLVYLAIVDIDNFKDVNDNFGHQFGDEVLVKVADIINKAIVGRGQAGRIGGDEIMLVLDNLFNASEVRAVLRTIRQNVEGEFRGGEGAPSITVSIGAARYPSDAATYDDVFKIADKMLYRAKDKGRNRYVIYSSDLHGNVLTGDGVETARVYRAAGANREKFIGDVLKQYLHEQRTSVQSVCEGAKEVFGLDEVLLISSDATMFMAECSDVTYDNPEKFLFLETEEFENNFVEAPVMVVNSVHNVGVESTPLYDFFNESGVVASIIYKISYEWRTFYLFFNKKAQSTRKWEDRDVILLQTLARILEIGMEDR